MNCRGVIGFFIGVTGLVATDLMGQDPCNPPCSSSITLVVGYNFLSQGHDSTKTDSINFGEPGGSFHVLNWHQSITINYPSAGIYTMIIFFDNDTVADTLNYNVACVPAPNYTFPLTSTIPYCPPSYVECYPSDAECDRTGHQYGFDDTTDTDCEFLMPDSCVTITPACVTASGQVSVLYGCGNTTGKLVKPLIFVEGLDFGSPILINEQYGDFGWPVLISGIDPADDPLPIQLVPNLLKKLNADGFDIVLLDFQDGATYIQANAFLLVTLINKINAEKIGNHELVVTGASMGGIVAKYALSYMENNPSPGCAITGAANRPHNARLFLSLDSPHNGANIPIGDQLLFYFMRILKFVQPDIKAVLEKLDKPAPKQLLVYNKGNIVNRVPGPHALRTQLLADANMNFPLLPRKVGISNGSCQGTLSQTNANGTLHMGPQEMMVNIWSEFIVARIKAKVWATPTFTSSLNKVYSARIVINIPPAPSIVYPGWRRVRNTYNYDAAPGGYRNTNREIDNNSTLLDSPTDWPRHCFIPTVSGLGLVQSAPNLTYDVKTNLFSGTNHAYVHNSSITPFDAIYAPDLNQGHIEITPENIDWIMEEISPKHLYLQNKTMNKPAVYEARDTITSGYDVDPVKTPSVRTLLGNYTIIPNCGDVTFKAGGTVTLKDGFSAKMGSKFRAYADSMCSECPDAMRYNNINNEPSQPIAKNISFAEYKFANQPINPLTISPNPSSGIFTITCQEPLQSIEVMDVLGNVIYKSQIQNLALNPASSGTKSPIDISSHPKGIYFLKAYSGERIFTEKIILH